MTIDDREVRIAKGVGLVEAGLAAGIEIPVFCYEPRLGAPVGACRMCLVEVEGMPKLQAGCTLTAQDGMVVRTAHSSAKAAEGQNATLEFILVNHPLDCPVCDKGGECPLQDLTFRYGPGNTRMRFLKRTFDKPIPVSPLIALDRERCILCYRCTRFSESVAEDGQLVAVNRGSQSLIATFEDEPYRAPFSGNVIELCPVGALTSTTYRFEARPWEIQNVPTVCGLCPVGCNVTATTREGKVKRILARNHPEVDEGWLCDKGRFAYPALRADDRVTAPLRRSGPRRFEELSPEAAVDEAEQLLRAAQGRIVTVFSGSETVELAYALAKLLRQGLGAHSAVLSEETTDALDAFRLPLSAIRDAQLVVVLGDDPVVERAPIVDLWLRAGRRAGSRENERSNEHGKDGRKQSPHMNPPNYRLIDTLFESLERGNASRRPNRYSTTKLDVKSCGEDVKNLRPTSSTRGPADALQRGRLFCLGLVALLAFYVVLTLLGRVHGGVFDPATMVYNLLLVLSAAICAARGLTAKAERTPWLLLSLALGLWATGDLYYTFFLSELEEVPYPSPADALYLSFYPVAYAALGILLRQRVRYFQGSLWLDGIIGGLVVAMYLPIFRLVTLIK